jgi:hypothetical protein
MLLGEKSEQGERKMGGNGNETEIKRKDKGGIFFELTRVK